jgi:hypothetical protein
MAGLLYFIFKKAVFIYKFKKELLFQESSLSGNVFLGSPDVKSLNSGFLVNLLFQIIYLAKIPHGALKR